LSWTNKPNPDRSVVRQTMTTPAPFGPPGQTRLLRRALRRPLQMLVEEVPIGPLDHSRAGAGELCRGGHVNALDWSRNDRQRRRPSGPPNGREWCHGPRGASYGHSRGRGQSASIPHAEAARTAPCQASAGVMPTTRIWFSPFEPSTRQTVAPLGPTKTARPTLQPLRWRRSRDSSAGG
jgi:hypothetical protein